MDPVEICGLFVEYTSGGPADEAQRAVLRDAVEAAQHTGSTPDTMARLGTALLAEAGA